MNASKRAAFELMMKRYATAKKATKVIARQALIDEGIYTSDGEVAAAYGGHDPYRKETTEAKK